jgi:hypothetical protein
MSMKSKKPIKTTKAHRMATVAMFFVEKKCFMVDFMIVFRHSSFERKYI